LWIEIWESRPDKTNGMTWVLMDELTHTEMKEKYGERAIAI